MRKSVSHDDAVIQLLADLVNNYSYGGAVGDLLLKMDKYPDDGMEYCDVKTRRVIRRGKFVGIAVALRLENESFFKRMLNPTSPSLIALFFIHNNQNARLQALSLSKSFSDLRKAWKAMLKYADGQIEPLAA
jgi:hypothetical protein